MRLHQIKKLLHSKENNFQNEETAYRMGKIFASYSSKYSYPKYTEFKKLNIKGANNLIN
jgi:hypothetical protein